MLCRQQNIRITGYVYSATETFSCSSKFIYSSILHIPTVVSVIVAVENPKQGLKNLAVGHSNVLLMSHSHEKEDPSSFVVC